MKKSFNVCVSTEEFELMRKLGTKKLGDKIVLLGFIEKMLDDDFYFENLKKFFSGEISEFKISSVLRNKKDINLNYSKIIIIDALHYLVDEKKICSVGQLEKIKYLESFVSFDKIEGDFEKSFFEIVVDNIEHKILVSDIIDFLCLPMDKFNDLIKSGEDICGIKLVTFCYIVSEFSKKYELTSNYVIPKNVGEKFVLLKNFNNVDYESINKFLSIKETIYKEFSLNDELKKHIVSCMPKDFTDLQKTMYIYIMMCKEFVYDEEFFVLTKEERLLKSYASVDYINTLSLDNKSAVCFEFNAIYAMFLNELNINFKSNYEKTDKESYGNAHVHINFRVGKFLINADPLFFIFTGDFVNAKVNEPLKGLTCKNKNENTKTEFFDNLNYVYNYINSFDNFKNNDCIDKLIDLYDGCTNSVLNVSIEDRINALVKIFDNTNFEGLELVALLVRLRRMLFTLPEQKHNFGYTLVKTLEEGTLSLRIVIFHSETDLKQDQDSINYLIYKPKGTLKKISKDELQELFDLGTYNYVEDIFSKIIGIVDGDVKIYER